MNIADILSKQQTAQVHNVHESWFRCYSVLEKVMQMVERGDSKETIKEVHDYLMNQYKK